MFRCFLCILLFKQKTAYEMRISDWSSDVCSSDLGGEMPRQLGREQRASDRRAHRPAHDASHTHQGPESCYTRKEQPSDIAKGSAKDQHRSKNTACRARPKGEYRQSVVQGTRVSVRVDSGGPRTLKKKNTINTT